MDKHYLEWLKIKSLYEVKPVLKEIKGLLISNARADHQARLAAIDQEFNVLCQCLANCETDGPDGDAARETIRSWGDEKVFHALCDGWYARQEYYRQEAARKEAEAANTIPDGGKTKGSDAS